MFVIRHKSGAYFIDYDGGGYIIGKKRDAKRYRTRESAARDMPAAPGWRVEELPPLPQQIVNA